MSYESNNVDLNRMISNDREMIKNFTNDFNNMNNGINEKIVSTMNRLNSSIADETSTNVSLKSLDEQINSIVLANTLKNLVAIKTNVTDKFKEYNELTLNNNRMASNISNCIKENKQVIDGINRTVSIINENIRVINETLDKLSVNQKI